MGVRLCVARGRPGFLCFFFWGSSLKIEKGQPTHEKKKNAGLGHWEDVARSFNSRKDQDRFTQLHNACGHTLTKGNATHRLGKFLWKSIHRIAILVSTTLYLSLYGVPNDWVKIGRNVKQLLPVPQSPPGHFYLFQRFVPVTKFFLLKWIFLMILRTLKIISSW